MTTERDRRKTQLRRLKVQEKDKLFFRKYGLILLVALVAIVIVVNSFDLPEWQHWLILLALAVPTGLYIRRLRRNARKR
ncbi:MAG TPA: hypothetical protein VM578_08320 [Candidatus Saccharimonadales bacterium]|nr:hypothetical protein [Candidatus Saccharimonadales bacterium]